MSYHWHPDGPGGATYPHLHLGLACGVPPRPAGLIHPDVHIPTGRVALEDLLRLAIEQLEVKPLRDDWAEVLAASQRAFEESQSWAQSSGRPAS